MILEFSLNNILNLNYFVCRWIVRLPGDPSGLKHYVRERSKIIDYVTKQIKRHETTFSPHNIRDYIDAFLEEFRVRAASGDYDHPFRCKWNKSIIRQNLIVKWSVFIKSL